MSVEGQNRIYNVNILSQTILPSPREVKDRYPLTEPLTDFIFKARLQIEAILGQEDKRLMVIVGPCSIHDEIAALEYANKLSLIAKRVQDTMCIVMRVYFEKPRTTIGWKGFINDPNLDDSFDICSGLFRARKLLLNIAELGLPVATEALDPVIPQYLHDLISWTAIGARTTESQIHREMASGLSTSVGFKNGTDGNIEVAINAIQSVMAPHRFLGVDAEGKCAIFHTSGNKHGHLVLRGGKVPNYDPESLERCEYMLKSAGLRPIFIIDCSHGNSRKDYRRQAEVFESCVAQRISGNDSIIGLMLESNLEEGKQPHSPDVFHSPKTPKLRYGVSITDSCIGWCQTEQLLLEAAKALRET